MCLENKNFNLKNWKKVTPKNDIDSLHFDDCLSTINNLKY